MAHLEEADRLAWEPEHKDTIKKLEQRLEELKKTQLPGGESSRVSDMLADAQRAAASRDLKKAREHVELARKVAPSTEQREDVRRMEIVLESIERLWEAVHEVARGLQGAEELTLDAEITAIVVEVDGDELWIMWQGRPRSYSVDKLPWELAVALAERRLRRGSENTELCIGCFLAIDAHGNREVARVCLRNAGSLGRELLSWLEFAPVKTPAEPAKALFSDDSAQGRTVDAGKGDVKVLSQDRHAITLNLERKIDVHKLAVPKPPPNSKLYLKLSGLGSWLIPAMFQDERNQAELNREILIKLKDLPAAEISVKFVRLGGGLALRIRSVYRETARNEIPLTTSQVQTLVRTVPKALAEGKAEQEFLTRELPQLRAELVKLGKTRPANLNQLQARNWAMRDLDIQINKGLKKLKILEKRVPELESRRKVLPLLQRAVNSLHKTAQLRYEVFIEDSEGKRELVEFQERS